MEWRIPYRRSAAGSGRNRLIMPAAHPEPGETPPHLSVVAPCFNEAEGLPEFCRQVGEACAATVGTSFEIVLINDGSRDGTWSVMRHLAAQPCRNVVAINLSRNYGHQIALTAGLHAARGERILIIDADLQDPPELLGEMMAAWTSGRRRRLWPAPQARRRDDVQIADRRAVLSAAAPPRRHRHSARHRRFPPDEPARARCAQRHARAVPLHPRHGELDRV